MCNMSSGSKCPCDYETDTFRPWAELPDLIIHSIAIRLTTFRVLAAFGGTCRPWRSIVSRDAVTESLIHRQPLTLLLNPRLSSDTLRFIRITDGKIHIRHVPGISKLQLVGQSFGHLIMASRCYMYRPDLIILLNIFTGAQIWCPGNSPHDFQQACLTAPPTSPDCLLVLLSIRSIQYRTIIERGSWTVKELLEGITYIQQRMSQSHFSSAVVIKDRLYAPDFMGNIVESKINPPPGSIPSSPRKIWYGNDLAPILGECNGKLVMVRDWRKVYQFNSSAGEWERIFIRAQWRRHKPILL